MYGSVQIRMAIIIQCGYKYARVHIKSNKIIKLGLAINIIISTYNASPNKYEKYHRHFAST